MNGMKLMSPKKIATALLALSACTAVRADYSNTVMSLNPLGYWRLNETAPIPAPDWAVNIGTAGAAANGYYGNGVAHPWTGALVADPNDGGASFNNNWVSIPNLPALNPNGPFTVECWANKGTGSGYPLGVMSSMSTTVNREGWLIYDNGSSWTLRLGSSAGYVSQPTGGSANVGEWYHLAGVYDGTNGILYVNGIAVDTQPLSSPYEPNPDWPTQIGAANNPAFGRNFVGTVDEAAIYTNALSAAEILAHYQNGTNASPSMPYKQLVLSRNPVAYYRLDEPAYLAPDPSMLPATTNYGSAGTVANGVEYPGLTAGAAGPPFGGIGTDNKAVLFSGQTGYIDCGPFGFDLAGPMSVMAWVKVNHFDRTWQALVTKGDSSWRLHRNGNTSQVGFGTTGVSNQDEAGTRAVDDGQWHHVVAVDDGSAKSIYIDGLLDASVPATGSISLDSYNVMIGENAQATGRFFDGWISEVAIFGTALTAAQIQQVYYSANVPPIIVQQPQAPTGTIYEGSAVTLSALVAGNPTLAYQWTKNGGNLSGKTSNTLAFNSVTTSDTGNYALVVTNDFGAATSSIVAVTVVAGPPLILQQPQSLTRYVGTSASFSVGVGGSVPYSFQWMFNGSNTIVGATTSSYNIPSVQPGNAGTYSCIVTNPYGSSNSVAATLAVLAIPAGYASVIMADHPIAYWRLGETNGTQAGDYAGGHNGVYNAATLGQPGFSFKDSDTAVKFGPGINSYVGNIQDVNFSGPGNTTTFSLEFWARGLPSDQIGDGAFICKGTGSGGEQFCIDGYSGHYRFYGTGGGGAQSTVSPDGSWQHVVGVCDGPNNQWLLYVNGQQSGSGTIPTTMHDTTHEVTLAARQSATGGGPYDFGWNGLLDEVAVYDHALTADQVLAHYSARYGSSTPPLVRSAPVSVTNYAGLSATFSVVAEGTDPLMYQWQKDNVDIPGEYTPTLTVSPLDLTSSPGSYRVIISNGSGSTNLAATLTVLPAPTSLSLTQDLVLHLALDGNFNDSSGRGNNAHAAGAPSFVPGELGTAISNNVDTASSSFNYVSVTNSPDLAFGANNSFSVSFWVNYTSWPNDDPWIGNAVGSTYQLGWVLCDISGRVEVSLASSGNSGTYIRAPIGGPRTADGAWHNVVMIVDRGVQQCSVYVDGLQAGNFSTAGLGTLYYNNPLTIGNDPTGQYGASGGGSIDDVGVWRRALSPLEAASIYVAGVSNNVSFASPAVRLDFTKAGNQLQLSWPVGGVLQSADVVTGPYNDVSPAPTSPHLVTPSPGNKFFRVRMPN